MHVYVLLVRCTVHRVHKCIASKAVHWKYIGCIVSRIAIQWRYDPTKSVSGRSPLSRLLAPRARGADLLLTVSHCSIDGTRSLVAGSGVRVRLPHRALGGPVPTNADVGGRHTLRGEGARETTTETLRLERQLSVTVRAQHPLRVRDEYVHA